jgi:hypothetical protein
VPSAGDRASNTWASWGTLHIQTITPCWKQN